eukprot:CAMPEP_0119472672 /NCGR_PEP_ID=MMETSP1344-20130328/4631_2 /TAXON_ID=236787 /ORGANISM="Florenciella parvula, Strain CCMP2471" /LENGTH=217 /DNA_ID=CAMNT_0007505649 /DNA_START=257 /DNA_END=911 /DNA_ORIENTATION=-
MAIASSASSCSAVGSDAHETSPRPTMPSIRKMARFARSYSPSSPGGSTSRHNGHACATFFVRSSARHAPQYACPHGSSTGDTTGPTQITHVSLSTPPPPPCATVALRLSVGPLRASAATAATQARLCCFQCFFWQGRPQYQARWHCEQHILLVLSVSQWKQRWISGSAAAPFPFLPCCLPVVPFFDPFIMAAPEPVEHRVSPAPKASGAARRAHSRT